MTERERLIELLDDEKGFSRWMTDDERRAKIADHLLDSGVIVPPVMIGDKLFCVIAGFNTPIEAYVWGVCADATETMTSFGYKVKYKIKDRFDYALHVTIGATAFFTREEAEKALKEREKK